MDKHHFIVYVKKKNYHLKPVTYKKKFKSEDISITLFEKIDLDDNVQKEEIL